MDTYLLDITTLITLISDICHDPDIKTRFGTLEDWKPKNVSIYKHIIDEETDPLLPKLNEILQKGKICTTQVAWDKFHEMIDVYGSSKEKHRMSEMKIEIVSDFIPEEFESLSGKLWSNENKSVFGTALKNGYTVITGNVNTLKDALNIDESLKYIAHRSRCFIGKKYEINK